MAGAATAVGAQGRGPGEGTSPVASQPLKPSDPPHPPIIEVEQVRPREGQDQSHPERWFPGSHPGSPSLSPMTRDSLPMGTCNLCPHGWQP